WQDGSGGGAYGERCERQYDAAGDCNGGGVRIHGECRCRRGRSGTHCERRCVEVRELVACAVLNGRLVEHDGAASLAVVEAHVRANVPPEFRDALCLEVVRRRLCHNGADERVRVAYVLMLHNTRHTWNATAAVDVERSSGLQMFRWLLDSIWHA